MSSTSIPSVVFAGCLVLMGSSWARAGDDLARLYQGVAIGEPLRQVRERLGPPSRLTEISVLGVTCSTLVYRVGLLSNEALTVEACAGRVWKKRLGPAPE